MKQRIRIRPDASGNRTLVYDDAPFLRPAMNPPRMTAWQTSTSTQMAVTLSVAHLMGAVTKTANVNKLKPTTRTIGVLTAVPRRRFIVLTGVGAPCRRDRAVASPPPDTHIGGWRRRVSNVRWCPVDAAWRPGPPR